MKRYLFILGLISLMTFSCDKVTKLEDDISFRKHNPYLILKPLDRVGQISTSECTKPFPFPSDSTQSVEIDMNQDGNNDFEFTYSTRYEAISPNDSCMNYSSSIVMKSIDFKNNILLKNKSTEEIQLFEEGSKVSNNLKASTKAIIYLDDAINSEHFEIDNGNQYIGIKMFTGGYGWIKLFHRKDSMSFAIMEHAYNNTIDFTIKAGQKN